MNTISKFLALVAILPALSHAAEYNLEALAKAQKLQLVNRSLESTETKSSQEISLSAAAGDGLAWLTGVHFSEGTIELEIKGKDVRGQSFVGVAFHGQERNNYDAVYFRPFNFRNESKKKNAMQYISMPIRDWSYLRKKHPEKYEAEISPAPVAEDWVKLKLIIKGKELSAFVNDADEPALTVELLNEKGSGKVGLWVGNGSDGQFRNLKIESLNP